MKKKSVKNIVVYEYDPDNDMVSIEYNGESIGYGNTWDIHPDVVLKELCKILKIKFVQKKTKIDV
jgi:hypothetical protein